MANEAERKMMDPCERVARELGRVQTTAEQHAAVEATRAKFVELSQWMLDKLPHNATLTVSLRNLVAAKDDAIRAILFP